MISRGAPRSPPGSRASGPRASRRGRARRPVLRRRSSPAPVPAPEAAGSSRFHLGDLFDREARQRHVFSLITACSMAIALSLVGDGGEIGSFLGSLIVILSGAAAALIIEREV